MSVNVLGFYTLTNKLAREDIQREFEEMFSMRAEEDVVSQLTEEYANYKQSYVKHLLFNPNTTNLSE